MNPDDPRHGERAGYLAGCRDECCREAAANYMRGRKDIPGWSARQNRFNKHSRIRRDRLKQQGVQRSWSPSAPVRAHIEALVRLGWSRNALAAIHGGVTGSAINILLRGTNELVQHKTSQLLNLPYSVNVPDSVSDEMKVPTLGAIRRIQALMAIGWPHTELDARLGGRLSWIDPNLISIGAVKWRKIDSLYRELCMTPGPSGTTRIRARELGYHSALVWDDSIDDPEAKPVGLTGRYIVGDYIDEAAVVRRMAGERLTLTKAERIEVVSRLRKAGWSYSGIEEHTGLNADRYITREKAAA